MGLSELSISSDDLLGHMRSFVARHEKPQRDMSQCPIPNRWRNVNNNIMLLQKNNTQRGDVFAGLREILKENSRTF